MSSQFNTSTLGEILWENAVSPTEVWSDISSDAENWTIVTDTAQNWIEQ